MVAHALQDKEDGIRALAATSLGDLNARSAIPALRKAMDDPSPVVSFAAAQSLWKTGDRSGRDLFHDVLTGERKTKPGLVQRHIDQVKKDVHDPPARALIGINEASSAFLGPFSMGVSVVEEYAKNTSAPAEALCAGLLSVDNTPDTVEQLALALAGRNWAARAAAAKALARMNRLEMIPQLTEMMNADKDEPARLVAAGIIRLKAPLLPFPLHRWLPRRRAETLDLPSWPPTAP